MGPGASDMPFGRRLLLAGVLLLAMALLTGYGVLTAVGSTTNHPDPSKAAVMPADTTLFGFVVDSASYHGVPHLEIDPAQILPADESMPSEETGAVIINDSDETMLVPLRPGLRAPAPGDAYWIELEAGVVTRLTPHDVSGATEFVPGEDG